VSRQQYKPRIVIVDDTADVRRDLRLLLEMRAWSCRRGCRWPGGYREGGASQPRRGGLDLAMPVLDGYAAAAIRAASPSAALLPSPSL